MLIPTEEFLMAVVTLARHPEWDAIRRWLQRQHALQSFRNDNQQKDTLLRMGQGKAQCLGQLTKLLTPETAARALETLRVENHSQGADDDALKCTAFC
ncbi:hypothetical protein [Candidatus Magnetominusculus dajiuhuensis]|uniref:hypothetical protein n=1 Tax=Candidatus Magnetominusculus dajiuhuensis TaxID=3137712 RepID=UPI003B428D4A